MASSRRKGQAPYSGSVPSRAWAQAQRSSSPSALLSSSGGLASAAPFPGSTSQKKKQPHILTGLHPSQNVIGGMPFPGDSQEHSPKLPPPSGRYKTRGTLNGYTKEVIYDDHYHPMDDTLRPKAAAKRRQKLKAQLTAVVDSSKGHSGSEDDHITLSSGSGSNMEDSDVSEEGPIGPRRTRTQVSTQQTQRSRRPASSSKPLYNTKKHPIDDLLKSHEDSTKPKPKRSRMSQNNTAQRNSSDTIYGESPQRSTADEAEGLVLAPEKLGPSLHLPEGLPSSIHETIQRVKALVTEAAQLAPLLPVLETHLRNSRPRPVQIYEDVNKFPSAYEHTRSRPGDGEDEKENVRDSSLDISWPRRGSSTDLMPPPRREIRPTLPLAIQRSLGSLQELNDPPSTGNTPCNSQLGGGVPRFEGYPSSNTIVASLRTIRDTHLTVSQSEEMTMEDDSQITPSLNNDLV